MNGRWVDHRMATELSAAMPMAGVWVSACRTALTGTAPVCRCNPACIPVAALTVPSAVPSLRRVFRRSMPGGLALLFAAWLCGCDGEPWVRSKSDPASEVNYQQADSWKRLANYPKAIELFQRALEVNPRNHHAHRELGFLFGDADKQPDPLYAGYHLRRYVELSGDTNDIVRNRIRAAEMQIAQRVGQGIGRLESSAEIEQLKRSNIEMTNLVRRLNDQLAQAQQRLAATTDAAPAVHPHRLDPSPATASRAAPGAAFFRAGTAAATRRASRPGAGCARAPDDPSRTGGGDASSHCASLWRHIRPVDGG
jgi:hypothetical protein